MSRPALEVAGIFREHGATYRAAHRLSREQLRVMRAIEICRTAALGGHVEQCGHCAHSRISYNSCRNRHCPKCQNTERLRWLEARRGELLPAPYFHVVFTVPEPIAQIALHNQEAVYGILFAATARTLLTLARDPKYLGAEIGFFAVLHTWGQNLLHHPHLHCVVPGGGIAPDGKRWRSCRRGFFLPVRALSRLFRRLFLEALEKAFVKGKLRFSGTLQSLTGPDTFRCFLEPLRHAEWVVYAKPPFGGPGRVLEYLGRYTHRVAISNHRLLSLHQGRVAFQWKDYRQHNPSGVLDISVDEFIRRFLLHTLPPGFQRVRHFGFLASRHRRVKLALCRQLLEQTALGLLPSIPDPPPSPQGSRPRVLCPACETGFMIRIAELPAYRWPSLPPPDSS